MYATLIGETFASPSHRIFVFRIDEEGYPNEGIFWVKVGFSPETGELEDMHFDRSHPVFKALLEEVSEDQIYEWLKWLLYRYDVSWYMSLRLILRKLKEVRDNPKKLVNTVNMIISRYERDNGKL